MFDLAFDRQEWSPSAIADDRKSSVTQSELKSMFQDVLQKAPSLDDFCIPAVTASPTERLARIARRRRLEALAAHYNAKLEAVRREDAEMLAKAQAFFEQPALTETAH